MGRTFRPTRGAIRLLAVALAASIAPPAVTSAQDAPKRDAEPPVKAAAPLAAPDLIKPAARFIYTHTSLVVPDAPQPMARPVADGGTVQHDIVAVLPDRVLGRVTGYAHVPERGEFLVVSTSGASVTAADVADGKAVWMLPRQLAEHPRGPGVEVLEGDWPAKDKVFPAVTITFRDSSSTTMKAYDRTTGLKLSETVGTGPLRDVRVPNGGLNRQVQRSQRLEAARVLDLPWLKADAKPPAWTADVRRMTYQGGQRMALPGGPPVDVPIRGTVTFTDRGDNWAVGTITMVAGDQPPTETSYVQGPASLDAYWMSPAALRDLKPGVIDTDPFLGTTVRYEVKDGHLGRLGVFTHTSARGTQTRTFGYSLEDGALTYIGSARRDQHTVFESRLTGRE